LTIQQLVGLVGTSEELYKSWTKKNGLPSHIESLEENAKLLWIGRKEAKRVILFFHGGGFSTPMTEDSITFWRYVQTQMGKSGVDVSVAVLDYSSFSYVTLRRFGNSLFSDSSYPASPFSCPSSSNRCGYQSSLTSWNQTI